MRHFRYYRPVAVMFLFEGIWVLADYAFAQLIPGNVFMLIIHYVGIIAVILYLILSILFSSKKTKKSSGKTLSSRRVQEEKD